MQPSARIHPLSKACAAALAFLLLALAALPAAGCAVAQPFRGPGFDRERGVTAPGVGDTVLVAVTRAVLVADPALRATFFEDTRAVLESLDGQPGLVGYSVRRQLLGDEAWTMTVWVDADALGAFVRSEAHRRAMGRSAVALLDAEFVRFELPVDELPVAWPRALAALEASAR